MKNTLTVFPLPSPCIPSPCVQFATCTVENDQPNCECDDGFTGNGFIICECE